MLLGRTALDGLLVDASRKYVLTSEKRTAKVIDPVLEHPQEGTGQA